MTTVMCWQLEQDVPLMPESAAARRAIMEW